MSEPKGVLKLGDCFWLVGTLAAVSIPIEPVSKTDTGSFTFVVDPEGYRAEERKREARIKQARKRAKRLELKRRGIIQ